MADDDIARGPQKDRKGWLLAIGFFLVTLLVFAIIPSFAGSATLSAVLSLGLLLVVPIFLGVVNAVRGSALPSTVAIGLAPTVAYLIVTIGRFLLGSPESGVLTVLGLAFGFAAIGIIGALAGFGLGHLGRRVATFTGS